MLLLVIIGAALLAFIIGDFFTSGRTFFGTGTTVAKVGSHKIEVQDLQRRTQQAAQQAQAQGRRVDNDMLNQQVLNQLIAEALFNQEVADLGLNVTDDELTAVMVGANSSYIDQMVRQQLGVESASMAHDMAFNPTKYGLDPQQAAQLQDYWVNLEKQMEQSLLQQKFQTLFAGTLVANNLDSRALYNDNATTKRVVYAKKDYSTLSNEDFPVTDADLQSAYKAEPARFTLDAPVRAISYISVDIAPSDDDKVRGQQRVEEALAALRENPETQGINEMTDFVVDRRKYTAKDLESNATLRTFTEGADLGKTDLLTTIGNDYTLAKLIGRPSEIDQATIDFLVVEGSKEKINELIDRLNSGEDFDKVAETEGVAQAQKDMELSLLDPAYATVKTMIEEATVGQYFTPDDTPNGGRIFRVSKRAAAAPVFDIATVTYTIEPSNATVNKLQADFQKYINDHKTAAEFIEGATEAGYTAYPIQVSASSPRVGSISDSHTGVAWAMEAKKGQVSPVYGDQASGKFYAVALRDIYDGSRLPLRDSQVTAMLTDKVRADKKAATLLDKYAGQAKDIEGYASLMDVNADTTEVNFGQFIIQGIGMNESEFTAAIANATDGQLVGPLKGNSGIIVAKVESTDTEGRPYDEAESAIRFNQQRGAARLGNNINTILLGNKKIDNRYCTFFK